MGDLLLHRGGREVSEVELAAVPIPPATPTWTPIPHHELLSAVRREINASGLVIARQQLALSHSALGAEGDRFFGLLEIQSPNETYATTIGVRNSSDRSFPAGLCVGSRVFVCSNLAFSAEVVISRKHTPVHPPRPAPADYRGGRPPGRLAGPPEPAHRGLPEHRARRSPTERPGHPEPGRRRAGRQ